MFAFGSIVLTRFPFTDLSGDKRRPALIVSRQAGSRSDVVVCFITSADAPDRFSVGIEASPATGLRVPSAVRLDKIATLNATVIAGKLGEATPAWLEAHRLVFSDVFGFRQGPVAGFRLLFGSNVIDNGTYIELRRVGEPDDCIEIFRSDETSIMTVHTVGAVPIDVVEWAVAVAHERLTS